MEEGELTKNNAEPSLLDWTQRRAPRSRGLPGVPEGDRDKKMRFNNLLHHVTLELLTVKFFDLKNKPPQASTR